ncbi:MAG: hypothetical protein ABSD75_25910 [Terriglobales bacterium]
MRGIHQQVAPEAEHVLDCFHIAMRFTNLQQLAKGVNALTDGGVRSHALDELDHAKWRFWNGQTERGLVGLVHLRQWAGAHCFDHIPCLKKLENALSEMVRYLELNAYSMPNYGKRYRAGERISTSFVESAVNEIVAKRMVKKQRMRWNRHTVQSVLDVRVHVLKWHLGKCISTLAQGVSANRGTASGRGRSRSLITPHFACSHDMPECAASHGACSAFSLPDRTRSTLLPVMNFW